MQRPSSHGFRSALRLERNQPSSQGSRFFNHAGQGEPRHPRSYKPGLLQGNRQRHNRKLRSRGRTARTERYGTNHHRKPLREPDMVEERYRDTHRRVRAWHHSEQRALLRNGEEQHRYRHSPQSYHRLQKQLKGS